MDTVDTLHLHIQILYETFDGCAIDSDLGAFSLKDAIYYALMVESGMIEEDDFKRVVHRVQRQIPAEGKLKSMVFRQGASTFVAFDTLIDIFTSNKKEFPKINEAIVNALRCVIAPNAASVLATMRRMQDVGSMDIDRVRAILGCDKETSARFLEDVKQWNTSNKICSFMVKRGKGKAVCGVKCSFKKTACSRHNRMKQRI